MNGDHPRSEPTRAARPRTTRSRSPCPADPDTFLELEDLRRREERNPELRAKERTLEQLHWRLAAVARRSARDDLDCRDDCGVDLRRTAGPFGSWLSVRHALRAEAALVLVLYGLYELARGMVVGNAAEAVRHARQLVALERSTGRRRSTLSSQAPNDRPVTPEVAGSSPINDGDVALTSNVVFPSLRGCPGRRLPSC